MTRRRPTSLRRRLVIQLLALSAVLSALIFLAVRISADRASEETLDAVLGAAAVSLAEAMRGGDRDGGSVTVDLSPVTFSMLAAMGEERIFYRVDLDGRTVTGYGDLPLPAELPDALAPRFYTVGFRDTELRVAAVRRSLMVAGRPAPLLVLLGQTRDGQEAIAEGLANRAALVGLVVFSAAAIFSLLAAGSLLRPIGTLAEAVGRRGPRDLRPLRDQAPAELSPFVTALNGFIARLRGTLSQTETFIAEAAHHIRTPLSVMRNEAELALRETSDEPARARLRRLIRAVDEGARSAGQLLDHATVLYRAGQQEMAEIALGPLVAALVERSRPIAAMRDITLLPSLPAEPLRIRGDAVLIEAALRNLLDNAVKYSPPDSAIDIVLATLAPAGGGAGAAMAEIRIADRGRGLDGAAPQAFTIRFRRGSNVGDVPGSGLGLTIVAEAAAAMGGRFDLSPREGGGTCATFALPLPG